MTFIRTIPPDEATDETLAMYERQQANWGYVPNYAKVFSHRPEVMAKWASLQACIKRNVGARRFELVTFAAARALESSYCTLAHYRALSRYLSDAERFSAPFFLNPTYATDYAPLPTTVDAAHPARYRPINWGEFRTLRAAGDYADCGAEVQISDYRLEEA